MEYAIALAILAGFAYFIFRKVAADAPSNGGGSKPNDIDDVKHQ